METSTILKVYLGPVGNMGICYRGLYRDYIPLFPANNQYGGVRCRFVWWLFRVHLFGVMQGSCGTVK